MSVNGIGGGAMSVDRIMAMRAQILEKNQALSRANPEVAVPATEAPKGNSFTSTLEGMLGDVNKAQNQAGQLSAAYERGETIDIAKVMLARQQASVGFEATLQVRNKLLSAYKDIMSMPV
ncbi:flagellar hook-basal body complex protein FliE [Sphingomonas qomolangmaensis]|uniref:Flagellar hook-basal body complex protein FliE n=1 Tax=Sphingomonas qomolangmaensis TaxID=2918765 RepID=A0ABY5L9K2_9SPHN|nr:flagellar hook-basal body complex protein FliE [Sphingomonas qomolangmaensis]UUL82263.1 flagellar hook-basal body complex protein FliE [Sphingomonas qomolangmaensis]